MKIQRPPSGLRMILLLSTVLAIAGCNDIAATARKFTYPPDFNYVSDQEFRSQMEQLAFQLQVLDKALVKGNTGQPSQQQHVLDALRKMERIGSSLKAGDAGSSHPFLQVTLFYKASWKTSWQMWEKPAPRRLVTPLIIIVLVGLQVAVSTATKFTAESSAVRVRKRYKFTLLHAIDQK